MKITEFIETYNNSNHTKKDVPYNFQSLDRLYDQINANMKKHCKLSKTPEFEINQFGKIISIYGARIV